jgi:hypothetical protein
MENKISIGLKLAIAFLILLIVHSVSNVLGSLGIISDFFIVVGVYNIVRFMIYKEVRGTVYETFRSLVDVEASPTLFFNFIKELSNEIKTEAKPQDNQEQPSE